jgi:RNA polymerase sigma factor (sigma-70 family)
MNTRSFVADEFSEIYARNYQKIFNYLERQLRQKETAEDYTQEVFMTLFVQSPDVSDEDAVCSYLYRCARWKVLNHIRRNRMRKMVLPIKCPEALLDEKTLGMMDNMILEGEVLDVVYGVFSEYSAKDVEVFLAYH